jgi:hypothetical protein
MSDDGKTFLQRVAERKEREAAQHGTKPPPDAPTAAPTHDDRQRIYALATLERLAGEVAMAIQGTRNGTLNERALRAYRIADACGADREFVTARMTDAARRCGLDDSEIAKTLGSARTGADKYGPADIPERETYSDAYTIEMPPADDAEHQGDAVENAIRNRLGALRIEREARRRLDDENRPPIELPPFKRLDELLAEPDTEQQYRIDQVAPAQARIMLNAQWKAGKTTVVGNVARSLVDREPFLGRFTVNTPAECLVLIDDELSERTVRRWLREQNITNTTAVHVITLRGKLSTFNLLDDKVLAEWAVRLGELNTDYLVLDCLRPILDALGLDERSDAGKFLAAYDTLLSDAGINDSLVVQHMGHAGERARGDSRLQDWPDAIWTVVRETPDDPDSARFFSAYGRDVNVPEGRLSFSPATRRLTYAAGSRQDAATEAALVDVVRLIATASEPPSRSAVELGVAGSGYHSRKAIRAALGRAVKDNLVTVTTGARNAKLHTIAYPCAKCAMPVASKGPHHLSCPPDTELDRLL